MTSQPATLGTTALVRSCAGVVERADARWRLGCDLLLGSSPTSQFLRYAFVGAVTSALYAVVFVLLDPAGYVGANAVGMILSTVVANEMHRRLTFQAAGRKSWLPAQLESGGLAAIGLGATTLALAAANSLVPGAPWSFEVAMVLVATGLIGIGKFFLLRGLVFGSTR